MEPAPVSPVSAAASEEEVVEVSVAVDKEREEMWGAAVDDEVEEAWGIAGPELAVPDDSDDELLDDDSAASDDSMFKSSEEEDNVEAEQDAGQEDDGQEPEGTGAEDTQGTSGLLDGDDDGGDWMGVAPAEEAGEKPPQLERLKTVEEDTDEQMQDIAFT